MMIFSDADQKARLCYNEIENEGFTIGLCQQDKEVKYLGYQHISVRFNFSLQKWTKCKFVFKRQKNQFRNTVRRMR